MSARGFRGSSFGSDNHGRATYHADLRVFRAARTPAAKVSRASSTMEAVMDQERARELLGKERKRIQDELAGLGLEPIDELSSTDLADDASDLYQEEVDVGRIDTLRDQLAAVERAEERLRDGRYGLSVESGVPIPDERLEVLPTAERTVAEEEAL
jgi:DnaK suppressor protein